MASNNVEPTPYSHWLQFKLVCPNVHPAIKKKVKTVQVELENQLENLSDCSFLPLIFPVLNHSVLTFINIWIKLRCIIKTIPGVPCTCPKQCDDLLRRYKNKNGPVSKRQKNPSKLPGSKLKHLFLVLLPTCLESHCHCQKSIFPGGDN